MKKIFICIILLACVVSCVSATCSDPDSMNCPVEHICSSGDVVDDSAKCPVWCRSLSAYIGPSSNCPVWCGSLGAHIDPSSNCPVLCDSGDFADNSAKCPVWCSSLGTYIGPSTECPILDSTMEPTLEVTSEPTLEPTLDPALESTVEPTLEVTSEPTLEPTLDPALEPTLEPTLEVTSEPTLDPTPTPSLPTVIDIIVMDPDEIKAQIFTAEMLAALFSFLTPDDITGLPLDEEQFRALFEALSPEELAGLLDELGFDEEQGDALRERLEPEPSVQLLFASSAFGALLDGALDITGMSASDIEALTREEIEEVFLGLTDAALLALDNDQFSAFVKLLATDQIETFPIDVKYAKLDALGDAGSLEAFLVELTPEQLLSLFSGLDWDKITDLLYNKLEKWGELLSGEQWDALLEAMGKAQPVMSMGFVGFAPMSMPLGIDTNTDWLTPTMVAGWGPSDIGDLRQGDLCGYNLEGCINATVMGWFNTTQAGWLHSDFLSGLDEDQIVGFTNIGGVAQDNIQHLNLDLVSVTTDLQGVLGRLFTAGKIPDLDPGQLTPAVVSAMNQHQLRALSEDQLTAPGVLGTLYTEGKIPDLKPDNPGNQLTPDVVDAMNQQQIRELIPAQLTVPVLSAMNQQQIRALSDTQIPELMTHPQLEVVIPNLNEDQAGWLLPGQLNLLTGANIAVFEGIGGVAVTNITSLVQFDTVPAASLKDVLERMSPEQGNALTPGQAAWDFTTLPVDDFIDLLPYLYGKLNDTLFPTMQGKIDTMLTSVGYTLSPSQAASIIKIMGGHGQLRDLTPAGKLALLSHLDVDEIDSTALSSGYILTLLADANHANLGDLGGDEIVAMINRLTPGESGSLPDTNIFALLKKLTDGQSGDLNSENIVTMLNTLPPLNSSPGFVGLPDVNIVALLNKAALGTNFGTLEGPKAAVAINLLLPSRIEDDLEARTIIALIKYVLAVGDSEKIYGNNVVAMINKINTNTNDPGSIDSLTEDNSETILGLLNAMGPSGTGGPGGSAPATLPTGQLLFWNKVVALINKMDPDHCTDILSDAKVAFINEMTTDQSRDIHALQSVQILSSITNADLTTFSTSGLEIKNMIAMITNILGGATTDPSYFTQLLAQLDANSVPGTNADLDEVIDRIVGTATSGTDSSIHYIVDYIRDENLEKFVTKLNEYDKSTRNGATPHIDLLIPKFTIMNIADMLIKNRQDILDYLFIPEANNWGWNNPGTTEGKGKGFTDDQIEKLTAQLDASTYPTALTSAHIKAIPYGMLVKLDSNQIEALTPTQIQAFRGNYCGDSDYDSVRQIAWFTKEQIEWFTENINNPNSQIEEFKNCQIQSFTCDQIPWFRNEQIADMTTTAAPGSPGSPGQVASFLPNQIPCFDWDQIQTWDDKQIQSLTSLQIPKFTTWQVAAFNLTQITWFRPDQIQEFRVKQVKAFTSAQVSVMTPAQAGALHVYQLHAFTAEEIASNYYPLTDLQLRAITDEQMNELPEETREEILERLSHMIKKWHSDNETFDLEGGTWGGRAELLDLKQDVITTLNVAGTIYPEENKWSASVAMYDELEGVLDRHSVGGKMEIMQTEEGTYVTMYDEDGTVPLVFWYTSPSETILIDWEKLVEACKASTEGKVASLDSENGAETAAA